MIDLIRELALVRDSLSRRKVGINMAIATEGEYLLKQGFDAKVIHDDDLPNFGVTEIAAYYLLAEIVEANYGLPIDRALQKHETWTVLANKVLETYDKSLL